VTVRRLARVVADNLRRNRAHFGLASIGVVVGIATFTFFLALGVGVRAIVLGKIFPVDRLEVVPRSLDVNLGPLKVGLGADALDDAAVASLRAIPGVAAAYPKMKLTVPALARGGERIFGRALQTELIADGIDPAVVAGDVAPGYEFRDMEDAADPRNAPGGTCADDKECPARWYCDKPPPPRPSKKPKASSAAPATAAVAPASAPASTPASTPASAPASAPARWPCRPFVPVLASSHLVEIYNGTLARAHGLPRLNADFAVGLTFTMVLGESYISKAPVGKPRTLRGMLVGFSPKAIPLGATLPIGYVKRFNVEFGDPDAGSRYHSVMLEVTSKDRVTSVSAAVAALGYALEDNGAEQAGLMIAIFMLVFGLVSAIIVGIAAVNIMHTFFMIIYERKREIGVLRAVGASRADIRHIILGEAAAVGVVTGVAGVVVAFAASLLCDFASARFLPDFPYKPQTYFAFSPALVGAAIGFAVACCLVGAFFPARRAAALDPAAVLSAP
jgi:hypothetical protein